METKTIRLTPDEVLDILKRVYCVKDARVHSVTGHNGMSWEGLQFTIYDKDYPQNWAEFEQMGG